MARSPRMARFRFAQVLATCTACSDEGLVACRQGHAPRVETETPGVKPEALGIRLNADNQPADPQAADAGERPEQGAGAAELAAEARRVHARLYRHPEEAQLGAAQGRQGAAHQWLRGDRLHPGRRA